MGINRTGEKVIRDMLVAASLKPIPRTKIMYGAFLSYDQLRSKMAQILERQLMTERDGLFYITPAGLEFIEAMKRVESIGVQK